MHLLNINIFLGYSLNDRKIYSEIENRKKVYSQTQHRQSEEEHNSVRIFPELSEEVCLVNHKGSNGDPT